VPPRIRPDLWLRACVEDNLSADASLRRRTVREDHSYNRPQYRFFLAFGE
jgi:hypothetical protein